MTARIPTGVPGFDTLLDGGLVAGGLYLLEGVPGAGKTILASQIAFHAARAGRKVLFVTLIAESHAKLLDHVSRFRYYDPALIGTDLVMLSAFQELLDGGLEKLLRFLAESMREHQCELLVLDGFSSAREFSESRRALAQFIHQLNTLLGALKVTGLLIAPLSGHDAHPEHTLVDGLFELKRVERGLRRAREIEVHKMRGSSHLTGQHIFQIGPDGLEIFPRLESLPVPARGVGGEPVRLTSGIPSLDALTGGGLVRGSATSLMGAPGVGKTLFGLSYLCGGAAEGRKGLYLGFYEAPQRLLAKARAVGLDLERHVQRGDVVLDWQPALEMFIDERAHTLLRRVRDEGIEQVFLDGAEGLAQASFYPERVSRFLTALTGQLSQLGVTTVLTEELPLFTADVKSKAISLSAMVENVLLLRFFEHASQVRRLITVVKLRDSDFDPSIREFTITARGVQIGEQIVGVEQVLEGAPHTIGGNSPTHDPAPR